MKSKSWGELSPEEAVGVILREYKKVLSESDSWIGWNKENYQWYHLGLSYGFDQLNRALGLLGYHGK